MRSGDCRRWRVASYCFISSETPNGCWCPWCGRWHWKYASPPLAVVTWGSVHPGDTLEKGVGGCGVVAPPAWQGSCRGEGCWDCCCGMSPSIARLLLLLCTPQEPRGSPELGNATV